MNSIKEHINKRIESGKLKMRPRSFFVLKGTLIALAIAALAGALFYLGSFALYVGCAGGPCPAVHELGEGAALLISLPWLPILAALLAAWGLERLLYEYAPAYRWPIAFSFGLLLLAGLAGSTVLHLLGAHERFEGFVEDRDVPIFRPLYEHYRRGP